MQLKEERTAFDIDDKSSAPEETFTSHPKEKIKHVGPKEKALNTITEVEDIIPRKSKLGRYSSNDVETVAEVKEQSEPPNRMSRRKRKSVLSKKVILGQVFFTVVVCLGLLHDKIQFLYVADIKF